MKLSAFRGAVTFSQIWLSLAVAGFLKKLSAFLGAVARLARFG